uniref:Putative cullin n=1 Tax=Trypanosoma vivax (strain Y486) TaxID=1055687 RepID=G0U727_TRYVY|nr:putative cullin [Trypanosoma vivax Y486]
MAMTPEVAPRDEAIDEKLCIIKDAVSCVLNQRVSCYSFQQVHHSVFQLCQRQCGGLLFQIVDTSIMLHVAELRDRLLRSPDTELLQRLNTEWGGFRSAVCHISDALLYLNTIFTNPKQTILEIGEKRFHEAVLCHEDVAAALVRCVGLCLVSPTSLSPSKKMRREFCNLYKDTFFEPLVEKTLVKVIIKQYRVEMEAVLSVSNVDAYITWAVDTIKKVRHDITQVAGTNAGRLVAQHMGLLLIKKNTKQLLYNNCGCGSSMVRLLNIGAIQRLSSALIEVDEMDAFLDMLVSTGKAMAAEMLSKLSSDALAPVVAKILSLRDDLQKLVDAVPESLSSRASPISQVLSDVVNEDPEFPRKLAHYYDSEIRSHTDGGALEQVVADTLSLFRLLKRRDVFENFFKPLFASRLIDCAPDDPPACEMTFINKLRNEYTDSVANHFEIMFKDGRLRSEINSGFARSLTSCDELPLKFNVTVITAGVWPNLPDPGIILPEAMQQCIRLFKGYYLPRHNGRRLSFHTGWGTAHFSLVNRGSTYELVAPTSFVNTILYFQNDTDEKQSTLEDVCNSTRMAENDVLAQLASLTHMRLVTEECADGTSRYMFNTAFTHHKTKLRLRQTGGGRMVRDNIELQSRVDPSDPHHSISIQAAIMEVMKSAKTIRHSELRDLVVSRMTKNGLPTAIAHIKQG